MKFDKAIFQPGVREVGDVGRGWLGDTLPDVAGVYFHVGSFNFGPNSLIDDTVAFLCVYGWVEMPDRGSRRIFSPMPTHPICSNHLRPPLFHDYP